MEWQLLFSRITSRIEETEWLIEAVAQKWSLKNLFLEISQNSQENTCARVSFLIKLQARLQLYKKRDSGKVFSCEFCEISKNTFVYRTPPVTASGLIQSLTKLSVTKYFQQTVIPWIMSNSLWMQDVKWTNPDHLVCFHLCRISRELPLISNLCSLYNLTVFLLLSIFFDYIYMLLITLVLYICQY